MKDKGYRITKEELYHIQEIKNKIHEKPELSNQEYETTRFIKHELEKLDGIEFIALPIKTGIVARIKGKMPGKTIALRADIDGIAQNEEAEVTIKSQVPGVMHACGHDFHTACLLGAALVLSRLRRNLCGDIILIFQPAEETTTGAQMLIEAGLLKKIHIDAIFGMHNRPEIPVGQVVVKEGSLMAAKSNFRIIVHGVGGHGSMPHKCEDPIICAAALIEGIQTIVSRNTDPFEPIVISIGSIHGGSTENLIVDKVEMTGSMRVLSEQVRQNAMKRLLNLVRGIAQTYGCTSELIIEETLPPVENNKPMIEIARKAAINTVGIDQIVTSQPSMASEDFSIFMEKIPGFFYWIGSGKTNETCYAWHNSKFSTNDEALETGANLLVQAVIVAAEELTI